MAAKSHCLHCGKFRWVMARGLCKPCRMNPAICDRYPLLNVSDETDADLDALVAERMRKLPAWWGEVERRKTLGTEKRDPAAILIHAALRRRKNLRV